MKLLRIIILLLALVGAGLAHAQAPPFPPNPTVGEEVTGPDGQIYVWDGVKWARKIPGAYAPETKTSVTAPANPTAGQLWFDPINLQTYIWYTDPTSSQWVAIVNGAGGGGGGGGLPVDNPTYTGLMTGPTLNLSNTTSSSLLFGSATTPNASIFSNGPNSLAVTSGTHFDGSNWIADAANPTIIGLYSAAASGIIFYANAGATVGASYTPTEIGSVSPAGFDLRSGQFMQNGVPIGAGGPALNITTFIPRLSTDNDPQPNATYTQQRGFYYVSGKVLHFSIQLVWGSFSGGNGQVGIDLPWANNTGAFASFPAVTSNAISPWPPNTIALVTGMNPSTSRLHLYATGPNGGSLEPINAGNMVFGASRNLYVQGWVVVP